MGDQQKESAKSTKKSDSESVNTMPNNLSRESISKVRKELSMRMAVLESNKRDRCLNGDDFYQAYQEYEALNWLASDQDGYMDQQQEYAYLFISSASRDPFRFPYPGHFKLALSTELDNVVRAELIQASFPLTDPTVNTSNYLLRFSLDPPLVGPIPINTVRVPVGSYQGAELAVEITRQLNQFIFSAELLAGQYFIDIATGFVLDAATNAWPVNDVQFYCNYLKSSARFIFQIVDKNKLPSPTARFALHVQRRPPVNEQVPLRDMNDDLYGVLGFNRIDVENVGTFDANSNTYYLVNDQAPSVFTGIFGENSANVDARYRRSIHSNQACDLRGTLAVVLDIDPLNDNDVVRMRDESGSGALTISDYFGFVLLRDPAVSQDRILELTNNTFPIRKYYREGRSRINSLTVTMRRPDGTVIDFGGADYCITLRLTCSRTQPPKPMFTR